MRIKKLPTVIRERQFEVICECPECDINYHFNKREIRIVGKEHADGTRWIEGTCDRGHLYRNYYVDFVQPTSPFFHLLYKLPEDEYNKKKKEFYLQEQQRKAELEKKYYYKYRGNNSNSVINTDEKKFLERVVLKED